MPIQFTNLDALAKAIEDKALDADPNPDILAADLVAAVGLERWAEKPYRAPRKKKAEATTATTTATSQAAKAVGK